LREGVRPVAYANTVSPDLVSSMPIENFFDYLSIRLNGMKAAESPMGINFDLPDQNKKYYLQIKNGVLNYFGDKNSDTADLSITINRKDLDSLIVGKATTEDLEKSDKLSIKGEKGNFQKFLSLFDTFNPWFNLIQPVN